MSHNHQPEQTEAEKITIRANTHHEELSHHHTEANSEDFELAGRALGTAQMMVDGQVVLIPTPSRDPNDPLLWSQPYKNYIAAVACMAALLSNFVAAGPTVAIVQIAIDFTGIPPNIPKTAYLFSSTSILQGVSNFFWIPLINKYGRRSNYIAATLGYLLCTIWAAVTTGYNAHLAARIFIGFFAGGAECLAPLVLTDIFFLHERGTKMAFYTTFLNVGVSLGIIIDGLIDLTGKWRWMYWIVVIMLGIMLLVIGFTFPETSFNRSMPDKEHLYDAHGHHEEHGHGHPNEHVHTLADEILDAEIKESTPARAASISDVPPLKTYWQTMAFYNGVFTEETLWKMFYRPFLLIFLPAVAFASLAFAVTIGFLVAITTNFAVALGGAPYNFTPTKAAACFTAGIIGGFIAIPFGGKLSDYTGAKLAARNGGIFQPEYRLPAIAPSIITAPLALVLYGVGIQHGLHWIVPTIGLGLLSFSIVNATNAAMVYAVDVYKPVAGEVVVTILAFKAIWGFALSYGTNTWIASQGYQNAFGEMAAISGGFLLLTVPLYLFGARIRTASFKWRIMNLIGWNADRDDVAIILH